MLTLIMLSPVCGGKMKLNIRKIIFVLLVFWLGVKTYDHYNPKTEINWDAIPNRTTVEITSEEVMEFLPVWREFTEKNLQETQQASLGNGLPEDNLSPAAQEWLLQHQWRPQRFFYVEQRLRLILNTLELRRHSEDVIKNMQSQLAALQKQQVYTNRQDPQILSMQNSIEKMIREQQIRMNIEKITPQELEMAAPLQTVLKEALDR